MAAFQGLLVVDKPGGITSRAAVDRALRWFPPGTRVGHTGTLDPLARGVLVLCVGQATRLTEYVQRLEKVYQATICLGARSDTDDAEGTITAVEVVAPPDLLLVSKALQSFVGTFEQVPPAHSAAKITGRRAYELARRGKEVRLEPRAVTIHAITLLKYAYPHVEIGVRCGKGTYIRSLARDLGEKLGCGGHVAALRRTRVGHFHVENALAPDCDSEAARARLLPMEEAVRALPHINLPEADLARLEHGQGVKSPPGVAFVDQEELAVLSTAGELVAVAKWDVNRALLVPQKILARPADC